MPLGADFRPNFSTNGKNFLEVQKNKKGLPAKVKVIGKSEYVDIIVHVGLFSVCVITVSLGEEVVFLAKDMRLPVYWWFLLTGKISNRFVFRGDGFRYD